MSHAIRQDWSLVARLRRRLFQWRSRQEFLDRHRRRVPLLAVCKPLGYAVLPAAHYQEKRMAWHSESHAPKGTVPAGPEECIRFALCRSARVIGPSHQYPWPLRGNPQSSVQLEDDREFLGRPRYFRGRLVGQGKWQLRDSRTPSSGEARVLYDRRADEVKPANVLRSSANGSQTSGHQVTPGSEDRVPFCYSGSERRHPAEKNAACPRTEQSHRLWPRPAIRS